MKYSIIIVLLFAINATAQNKVVDLTGNNYTEFVQSALTLVDVNNSVVIIRSMDKLIKDAYGKKVIATVMTSKEHPNMYSIFLTEEADKIILSHEIIHIKQAYDGRPCNKHTNKCEAEADQKKHWVLNSIK